MKKEYSLALWWWAARWFAHIWVIKYLEENNICINEISGTSIWAIIWWLYALWKTSKEIEEFAKSINYFKLIDLDFKLGLFKGKNVYEKLKEIFWDKKIEDLDISLKIVATNIETSEKKVFEKWKIIDAIRASISLPWIFIPYVIWEDSYVDWWIVNNLPIEVLNWKDIIAISALKKVDSPIKKRKTFLWFNLPVSFFNLNFQILQRTILIMMKQNEDRSINTENKNIIYLNPVKEELDFFNFNKVDEFISLGYEWIKNLKPTL